MRRIFSESMLQCDDDIEQSLDRKLAHRGVGFEFIDIHAQSWPDENVFELVISSGFREHSPSGRVEPQARRGFNDFA